MEKRSFELIQLLFLIKTCRKQIIESNFLNSIRSIYEKFTTNITLNGGKLNAIPLKLETRQGCPLSPILINIVLGLLSMTIRQEKETNPFQIGKEEEKLSLFIDNVVICLENPLEYIHENF